MHEIAKKILELDEMGCLHNENCCVNFEDSGGCDAMTPTLGCCENMQALSTFSIDLVKATIEFMSYDMQFKDEDQRQAACSAYRDNLQEGLIHEGMVLGE